MLTIVVDLEVSLEAAPFGHLGLELQTPVSTWQFGYREQGWLQIAIMWTDVLYLQTPPLLIQLAGNDSLVKALSNDQIFKLSNATDPKLSSKLTVGECLHQYSLLHRLHLHKPFSNLLAHA